MPSAIRRASKLSYGITDSHFHKSGLMKGGVVGECPKAAFICEPTTLVPGLKARLLIETANGLRHITTSIMTAINRRSD